MDIWRFRFRRTTLLLWLCVAILVGLAASHFGHYLAPSGLALCIGALLIVVGRLRTVGLIGVIVVGLCAGGLRGTVRMQELQNYQPLYDQKITLKLSANEDAVYGKGGQLTFVGVRIYNAETSERLPGQIGVSGYGPLAIYQDDEIIVHGTLRSGVGSYQGFISFGELELLRRDPSLLAEVRRTFGASILSVLPEPQASFAMGILIGQRATLPEEVKENLQKVGLTHIIAVSGANLTIMLQASQRVLGKRSKRLTTWVSLSLMLVFVLMTGGTASIVRAAFVSGLSVLAAYYGRRPRPLIAISLVAALTASINPIYLWSDASWYLSFLAFFGVLMLSPLLQARLPNIFQTNIILAIALESICAEIMSLPYILFTFGEMSFVGLLANVLVVSFIPYAMLFGFIAGLAGLLLWPIAGWFAWPAKYVMMYMLDTAHVLANRPGVFTENIWLSLPGVIFIYSTIAAIIFLMSYKERYKNDIITDKNQFEPVRILGRLG